RRFVTYFRFTATAPWEACARGPRRSRTRRCTGRAPGRAPTAPRLLARPPPRPSRGTPSTRPTGATGSSSSAEREAHPGGSRGLLRPGDVHLELDAATLQHADARAELEEPLRPADGRGAVRQLGELGDARLGGGAVRVEALEARPAAASARRPTVQANRLCGVGRCYTHAVLPPHPAPTAGVEPWRAPTARQMLHAFNSPFRRRRTSGVNSSGA